MKQNDQNKTLSSPAISEIIIDRFHHLLKDMAIVNKFTF